VRRTKRSTDKLTDKTPTLRYFSGKGFHASMNMQGTSPLLPMTKWREFTAST
jgi:hypothetical protein